MCTKKVYIYMYINEKLIESGYIYKYVREKEHINLSIYIYIYIPKLYFDTINLQRQTRL